MPNPIGSNTPARETSWPDPEGEAELHDRITRQLDEQTYGACRDPRSVVGGMICGDKTAVSNACRRAKPGSLDDLLCDDKKLEKVQSTSWDIAQKAIELILGSKMGK